MKRNSVALAAMLVFGVSGAAQAQGLLMAVMTCEDATQVSEHGKQVMDIYVDLEAKLHLEDPKASVEALVTAATPSADGKTSKVALKGTYTGYLTAFDGLAGLEPKAEVAVDMAGDKAVLKLEFDAKTKTVKGSVTDEAGKTLEYTCETAL